MSDQYLLLVNDERTILVRIWKGGTVEVCTRFDDAIWGPPHIVRPEGAGTLEERFQFFADMMLTPATEDAA